MFNFLNDAYNYEERKVANDTVGDAWIDTCRCSDGAKPYETAIEHPLYNSGKMVIVEAYNTAEEARAGHSRWITAFSSETLPAKLTDCNNAGVAQLGSALFGDEWPSEFDAAD